MTLFKDRKSEQLRNNKPKFEYKIRLFEALPK